MPRPPRETGGSTIDGGLYYGHRTDFSKGEENTNGGLDNHYYNVIALKDNALRYSVKIILSIVLVFLIVKAFR
jgi:hypothetical protein